MRILKALPVLLTSALVLASCSGGDSSPDALSISLDGLNGIGGTSTFDPDAIQEMLPDYQVAVMTQSSEGEPYPVIGILDGEELIAELLPNEERDRVDRIRIVGRAVRPTYGAPIGTSFLSAFEGEDTPACEPGIEEYSGSVICQAPRTEQIRYVFSGEWNGPDGVIPPEDVFWGWTLNEIWWFAPRLELAGDPGPIGGRWEVIDYKFSSFTAMTEEEAGEWIGTSATFTSRVAGFEDRVCPVPSYEVHRVAAEELLRDYSLSAETLGTAADELEVYSISCMDDIWTEAGSTLLVVDDHTILAPWDGVLFVLIGMD